MQPYITALAVGLGLGGMYALVAMGYNLVYSSTRVFNFAQGDLLTYGGLFTYTLVTVHHWSIYAALVPVVVAVGLMGLVQERITIAPILRRGNDSIGWIVTTLGASVILANLAQLLWGTEPRPVKSIIGGGSIKVFGAPVLPGELLIIVVAIVVGLGLELWSRRTDIGRAWKAISEDPEAASVRGIAIRRVAVFAFVCAAAISGFAGLITVPVTEAVYNAGALLSLNAFVAIALGGFGSQAGALVGGVILGIVQSEVTIVLNPNYQLLLSLALLVLVLLLRPSGLFGRRVERLV